ncbi:MAG: hypothetical protein LBD55_10110 [Treponema sp.]|jgi:hypothetical protein|nr:hypothetical protein [Treponema sp.]
MKNIVRLILIISICFAVVFLLSLVVKLLQIRIESVRAVPVLSGMRLQEFIAAAQGAFPVTIYCSTLLGISYTARRGIPIPVSIICSVSLGMICTLLISLGISILETLPESPPFGKGIILGEPGLIFSHADRVTVFLEDPGDPQNPKIIAIPDHPLVYQKASVELDTDKQGTAQGFGFSPTLLRSGMYFFLYSMLGDFDFAAIQFKNRFQEGFMLFLIYMFSLMFLLSSMRFIMDMSAWPLANLFLGILAFRGILALERLCNSEGIQRFLTSFMGDRFPHWLISPLVFGTLGVIIILYTALIHLGKNRRTDETF